jgi:nucleotide-binding universal stress UspA family protein
LGLGAFTIMKKVLLMTDFSKSAENSIRFALNMLNDTPIEFTLLHSYSSNDVPPEVSYFIDDVSYKQAVKQLNQYKKKLIESDNLPYHKFKTEVMQISPDSAASILHNKNHYDLIVLGATGSGGNPIFGSVATNVVRNIQTNTLVVPSTEKAHGINKIVLAVDYQEISSFEIYDFLKHIAERKNSEITFLTILKEDQKPTNLDSFMKYQYHDSFKDFKTFDYFIKENDVETGLNEYLETHKVDMMVMVSRHHTFMDVVFNRSVTRPFAFKPTVPMLCVYDKKVDDYLVEIHSEELVAF